VLASQLCVLAPKEFVTFLVLIKPCRRSPLAHWDRHPQYIPLQQFQSVTDSMFFCKSY
jgi:hypothetical protein